MASNTGLWNSIGRFMGRGTPPSPPALVAPVVPAVRQDAATQTPYDGGGLVNPLSGLGTVNDKGSAARPNLARLTLSNPELEYLYRFSARRLINIVPNDCTRKGWQVEVPDVIGNPFMEAESRLHIAARFRMGHIWARVFGGSRGWMVVREKGNPPLSTPLDPRKVTRFSNIIILTPDEYSPLSYCSDPEDDAFGLPDVYNISPMGFTTRAVHHTRLLTFNGGELTRRGIRERRGNGESLLEAWWDALRNDNQLGAAGAHLAQELSVFWIQMKNRAAATTGGQASGMLSRLAALNISKSIANAVLLADGEKIGEIARSTAGFKDLSEDAKKRLALQTGYPLAVIYGESPSGLNTDGDSHRKIWTQIIAGEHKQHYDGPLHQVYTVLWNSEHHGEPEHWTLKYHPIDELTEEAQAGLEKTHAETDQIRIESGTITPDEARSRWSASGYQTSITVDLDEEAPGPLPAAPMLETTVPANELEDEEDIIDAEVIEDEEEDRGDSVSHRISAAQRRRMVKIPRGAQLSAQKVLRWKKAHGLGVRGLSPRVFDRCRQIARGGRFTVQDVIDLNSWHARSHRFTKLKPQFAGSPWRDSGYVAGQACGGEVMARYAAREVARYATRSDAILAAFRREDIHPESMILAVPLPESVGYSAMQQLARAVLPDLVLDDWGHVTVLYLGQVPADRVDEVRQLAKQTIADFLQEWDGGTDLEAQRVGHFSDAGTGSPETPLPIVIDYYAYGLRSLQDRLTRALAHLIGVQQFPVYRPHATLGYLARPLTGEESAQLLDLVSNNSGPRSIISGGPDCDRPSPSGWNWTPETILLRRGGHQLATFNLISARLDGEE